MVIGEFSPDGRTFLTVAAGGKRVYLWDTATGRPAGEPLAQDDEVNFATFGPEGRTVVVATGKEGGKSGGVHFWDIARRTAARPAVRLDSPAMHVAISRDESRAAVSPPATWCAVVAPSRPRQARRLSVKNARQVFFTPDGRRLVTFLESRKAYVWDTASGRQVGQTIERPEFIHTMDVSPDGRYIATGCDDKHVRVWNLETGLPVTPQLPHRNYINSVQFSPDGRRLVSASADGTARVWDLATDQPTPAVGGHRHWMFNLAFSPDGRRIVTACAFGPSASGTPKPHSRSVPRSFIRTWSRRPGTVPTDH